MIDICSESANSAWLSDRRTAYRRLRFCQCLDSKFVLTTESAGFCICLYSLSTFNCSRNCGSTSINFLVACISQQQAAEVVVLVTSFLFPDSSRIALKAGPRRFCHTSVSSSSQRLFRKTSRSCLALALNTPCNRLRSLYCSESWPWLSLLGRQWCRWRATVYGLFLQDRWLLRQNYGWHARKRSKITRHRQEVHPVMQICFRRWYCRDPGVRHPGQGERRQAVAKRGSSGASTAFDSVQLQEARGRSLPKIHHSERFCRIWWNLCHAAWLGCDRSRSL